VFIAIFMICFPLLRTRCGSAASAEASLLADARCRLHSLVVRRFAPNGQRMESAAPPGTFHFRHDFLGVCSTPMLAIPYD
jgi:hypothetical protein